MIECDVKDCGYRLCRGFEVLVCPYCMIPFSKAVEKLKKGGNWPDTQAERIKLLEEAYKALDNPHDMRNITLARSKINAVMHQLVMLQKK